MVIFTGCIFDANKGNDYKLFGVWESRHNSNSYITLRSNYSYDCSHSLFGYYGEYKINGDTVTFTDYSESTHVYKYLLNGNFLTFYDIHESGNRYIGDYIKRGN